MSGSGDGFFDWAAVAGGTEASFQDPFVRSGIVVEETSSFAPMIC
jgi:hypothetical protein